MEQDLLHALVLHPLPMNGFDAEGDPVLAHGRFEVGHGDPHVVDVFDDRTEDRSVLGHVRVGCGAAGRPGVEAAAG